MTKYLWIGLCWLGVTTLALANETSPFVGKWKLDLEHSSAVKPWTSITLDVAPAEHGLAFHRHLFWSNLKQTDETIVLRPDDGVMTENAVPFWVESAYSNAYLGGDRKLHVKAGWLDHGRILKAEIDAAVDVQQGDYPVHIYREYRLSADRQTLRVFELRSTRDQALTFIYTRA